MADDKPAHILEIPDSLGRDVDRARAGTGPAPPIEAFMSDQALETAERMTRAADPVHAESLRPISKAEAATRTTFNGESLPRLPATRRVIPAPFRRPRIDLTLPWESKRDWQYVRADQVSVGDTVPDIGLVVSVEPVLHREVVAGVADVPVRTDIVVRGKGGISRSFQAGAQVHTFRQAD